MDKEQLKENVGKAIISGMSSIGKELGADDYFDLRKSISNYLIDNYDVSYINERVFTFDQMMDVITEFATWVDTSTFYNEGEELKKELIPHVKNCVKQ